MRETIAYESFATRASNSWIFAVCPVRGLSQSIQVRTNKNQTMNIISLIIEIISGAIGGNVAGAAMKQSSLGTLGNSIAGIVGGGLGGTILQSITGNVATGGGSLDLATILSNVAGGGVGGAILMAVIGLIKNQMAKK
jgi:uncharacterized membrane protein YeaQ/YmgE (transglycosylase-associated protein family)